MKYTDEELETLWTRFAECPINEHDEIDESFHIWGRYTDIE